MKNIIYSYFIIILLIIIVFSCKNDYDEAKEDENVKIKEYLKKNNLTNLQPTESGIYYIKIKEGTGDTIHAGDFISVVLNGTVIEKDLNPKTVDSNLTFIIGENQLVQGLDEGIQLMREGEKARFIVPFAKAYYSPNAYTINYNTYLFEVEINEIIDDIFQWEMDRINKYVQNDTTLDATPDSTGFCYISLEDGQGDLAQEGNYIEVLFTGKLLDGTIFDDSHSITGYRTVLDTTSVIKGWVKGISMMRKNGKAILIIPSSLAYDSLCIGPTLPSYSSLVFTIELTDIMN